PLNTRPPGPVRRHGGSKGERRTKPSTESTPHCNTGSIPVSRQFPCLLLGGERRVFHPHEGEPLSRQGRACLPSILGSEHLCHPLGRMLPVTYLDQGPSDDAHHVIEKCVSFDGDLDQPAVFIDAAAGQRPYRRAFSMGRAG